MKKFSAIITAFIVCLIALLPQAGYAQPGTLDTTFNRAFNFKDISTVTATGMYKMLFQPNGKIIVVGQFVNSSNPNAVDKTLLRFNSDGSFDESFDTTEANIDANGIVAIALTANGKILLINSAHIWRLNTDGSIDATFNSGFVPAQHGIVSQITELSDGKILVLFDWFNNGSSYLPGFIMRLNSDGSVDGTFASVPLHQTDLEPLGNTFAVQADGKIVVFTLLNTVLHQTIGQLSRLNADGSFDNSFTTTVSFTNASGTSVFNTYGNKGAILLQPDGKILVGGHFTVSSGAGPTDYNIARFNADGSQDHTFHAEEAADLSDNFVTDLAIKTDGKILIAYLRYTTPYWGFFLEQVNTDGSRDFLFNPDLLPDQGTGQGIIFDIEIRPTGKIFACGRFNDFNGVEKKDIVKLNSNGSLDNAAGAGDIAADVKAMDIQTDGKIVVGGRFQTYNGVSRNSLARLNNDGSLDENFDPATGSFGFIKTIAVQNDGKIIAGGAGNNNKFIARFNIDESEDAGFANNLPNGGLNLSGTGTTIAIDKILLQPDDKIIVIGIEDQSSGGGNSVAVRLNSDGSTDPSFTTYIAGGEYYDAALQPDGKIILAGNLLIRLNSDGSVDQTFTTPQTFFLQAIKLQPDGKVLIAGSGSFIYNNVERIGIARLNADGSLDESFVPSPTIINSQITPQTISLQSDGKIILGGSINFFTSPPEQPQRNNLLRLNSDGSVDNSFNHGGTGFNLVSYHSAVFASLIQPDGELLVAGGFNSAHGQDPVDYNGSPVYSVARIFTAPCTSFDIPSVNISAVPAGSICAGTSVTFTATPVNGGGNPFYQWRKNNIDVGSSSAAYTDASLANGDIITCKLISRLTCVSPDSANSNSIIIPVNPSVTPSVSIALTTGTLPVCAGSPLTFTATPVNPGATPSYQWKINGSTNIGSNSPVLTYSNFFPGNSLTCVLTNNGACVTQPVATSNAIIPLPLTGIPPSVSIAVTAGTNPDCSADPITFTATPVNGGSSPAYQWFLNGNPVATGDTYTITSPSNNDMVSCNMTSSLSCANPAAANSNIITIKTAVVPVVYIGAVTSFYTCELGTLQFYAPYDNGGTNPTFQWKLNGNDIPGATSSTYSHTGFIQGDAISVSMTSSDPCAIPATVNSYSVNITVYSVLNASLSISGDDTYCAGSIATFFAYQVSAGNYPTYFWTKNGNPVGTSDQFYQDNGLVTGDVVSCSITTDPACETPVVVFSGNSITVTINPPVTPAIIITSSNPASSLSNYFTAAITNGGSNPSYEWRKNDIIVGSDQNSYLDMALIPGDIITCTLYSNAECTVNSSATSNSITVTSINYCIPNTIYGYNACELAWISNVVLGTTINKVSGCNGFYSDYTLTDTLKTTAGQVIDFTVTEETDGTNWGMYTNIYIDYNQDGDFDDAGEKLTDDIYTYVGSQGAGTFTVPLLIAPGSYRMRVMLNASTLNACELAFGEAEDYILQVTQPDYCIPLISSPCDMWISNVMIGAMNNSSTSPVVCTEGGYTDYSSVLSAIAGPGQTVSFSIAAGNNYQYADIYIDYNADGDFDDPDEWVAQNLYMDIYGNNATGSFIVPTGQAYGYYRMRVRSHAYDGNPLPQPGACDDYLNGETEDYTLIVNCIPNGSDIVVKGNDIIISDGDNTPDIADFTDFGSIVYNTSTTKTFFIENTGTNTLNISGVTVTGPNAYYFTVINPPATSIPAGGSTSFTVQFYAGYIYTYQAVMHINTDNCDKKDYDIAIQGTGVCPAGGPDINVQGNGIDIARFDYISSPDDNTDFGTVTANNSLSKTFVIQNTGIADLEIYGVQLFNYDNLLQFDVTGQPAAIVAPGNSTSFTISFNAAGSGPRYAYVRINSTDCDESYYDFRIDGNAVCPVLAPEINVKGNNIDIEDGDDSPDAADNTDFGQATASAPVIRSFIVENTGEDPLSISGITFSGTNAADFSVITLPAATVAPGGTTSFSIRFLPTGSGASSATMHINNNDCDEGDYDITLQGTSTCVGITAAATITTSILCHGGTGIITIAALGGTLPIVYSLNGVTNNDGIFTVSAGTDLAYNVTDANNCTAATGYITITQPAGIFPDISLGADYSANFFEAMGNENSIVYNISEIGGNPSTGDTLRIIKIPGYSVNFNDQSIVTTVQNTNYNLDNRRWKLLDTNPVYVSLVFDPYKNNIAGLLSCNERVYVEIKLKRNTPNASAFALSSRLRRSDGETSISNNLNTIVITAE